VPEKISVAISSLMERGPAPTGASIGSGGAVLQPMRSAVVLQRLMENTPQQTDAGLLTWLKSQGVGVTPEIKLTYPPTGGYRRELTGFTFSGLTPEVRQMAREHTLSAMTPPSVDDCEAWITTMHAVMAHRGSSATALEIILTVYAGCLRRYPADVAKAVCSEMALRREKPNWFPTLSELDEALDNTTDQRSKLLASLSI
jgi:hypothetical protein